MKKALVVGCHVNGLGVIRSLKSKGFKITAMFYNKLIDFAHTSRYVDESVEIPNPRNEETEFIDFLVRNSKRWKDALIVDTNDDISIALSKNKEKLKDHYRIITPEWPILKRLIGKPETYSLAQECDVPYPKTFLPKTVFDLQSIKNDISYPCILKPIWGHLFFTEFHAKNFEVNDFSELLSKFELCSKSGHEVMVQEIIPGPDSNIHQCAMYINVKGDIAATFVTKKIRQNPPAFGVARVASSVEVIPEIKEFTEKMLKRIGFKGIVHSEFKKDPRDHVFKLMEINGRIPRSNWLAAYCGVNFPWLAYMDLSNDEQIAIQDYKKGVYWIEIAKDISNAIFNHDKENLRIRDYLKPYFSKNKTFADISIKDFRPVLKRGTNLLEKKIGEKFNGSDLVRSVR